MLNAMSPKTYPLAMAGGEGAKLDGSGKVSSPIWRAREAEGGGNLDVQGAEGAGDGSGLEGVRVCGMLNVLSASLARPPRPCSPAPAISPSSPHRSKVGLLVDTGTTPGGAPASPGVVGAGGAGGGTSAESELEPAVVDVANDPTKLVNALNR